jgi:RHS repeat-associated protein
MMKQGKENIITHLITPKLFLCVLCFILITVGVAQSVLAEENSKAGNVVSVENNPKNPAKKEVEPKKNDFTDQVVSPTGAFQYKVPLNLPEGINQLAPELTLLYNSQGSNGVMGMGWSIEGLPQIKRDFSYTVNYATTDHFTYNGEKLIKNSGTGYYHLEKETYERIEYNASLGYWVVTGKNGTKYYFGYQAAEHSAATDGRINVAGDSSKVLLWSLSKVVDIHGNYYFIEYNEDATNGDFYVVRITYTQNEKKTVSALRTVEFSYETRNDHYVMYSPTKLDMDHRLKYITVKMGSKLLRKWRLDYAYGIATGRSILTGIQEYGSYGNIPAGWEVDDNYVSTGKTLPKLCFEWQSKTNQSQFQFQRWATKQGGYASTMQWFVGDFNGDGKADMMKVWDENGKIAADVHVSTGSGFEQQRWATKQGGYISTMKWFVGDFNGDGKTDTMKTWNENGKNSADVHIATGTAFEYQRWATKQSGYCDGATWFVGDFNGDGKMDMMKEWDSNGKLNADVHISTGGQFEYQRWAIGQGGYSDTMQWFVGDFNGDGKTDLMKVWNNNGKITADVHVSESSSDLIGSISKEGQTIIGIEYIPAPHVSGAVASTVKSYPDIANSSPLPLVTQLMWDDGLGHTITDRYSYSNSMIHVGQPYEQEALGFAWIEKQNEVTGSLRTYYRQDDVDLRLMVDQEEVRGTDGKLYTVKQYEYQKRPNAGNSEINFIYTANEYTYNYNGESDTPVQYRVEFDYDNYGNLKYQKKYGDSSVIGDEQWINVQYNYYIDSGVYLCLPSIEQKYGIKLDGQEGLAAETRSYYDASYNLEHQELENGATDVVIKYGYDVYGNVTSKTDGNGNTTTYVYDDQYQTFLRYETLKFTTETIYDDLMRRVKQVDANGQVWETVYDVFSRENASISPGDSSTAPTIQIAYPDEFVDSSGTIIFPQRRKTAKKVSYGNYIEVYQYYDGLDRVVQEKTEAKDGWITVDHIYDSGGRECQTSMPYYTSSLAYSVPDGTVKAKSYQFDPIGRIAVIQNPDQTNSKFYYSKYDTFTVDPLGHVTNKRIVGNIEYNIKYTGVYPSHAEYSKTTKITACDGVKTIDATGRHEFKTNQDLLGRTVGTTNSVNGTWKYSYDGNNNLISQTDAKDQTITFKYDLLNRITTKLFPDGKKVNYFYDESGYGYSKDRLTRVKYEKGLESYTYDRRGRTETMIQTIADKSRTKKMTYNAMDQVTTETYPDGEVVNYSYDTGGQLTGLKGATSYLTGCSYYATGKISEFIYGNNVKTNYDYYDTAAETDSSAGTTFSNRLKQIRVSKSNDLLNLNYQYDQAGNVKAKRDSLASKYSETYGYDDLNRLTSASSTSYGNKNFAYDTVNNITQKDGYTYKYDTDNDYRLLNDGRFTYTYDANGSITGRSDGRSWSWDYENRVKSLSDGSAYSYNADDRRIGKVEGGLETYYFFDDYEEIYKAGNKLKTVKYYFANKMRIAENSSVDGIRYYHQDHLSSTTAITNSTGALVLRNNNAPYGEDAASEGKAEVKYKFTDKEKDGTGLYYFGARFYDPEVGRFISVDPNKDGMNWYSYCGNNPVKYVDPTGMYYEATRTWGVTGWVFCVGDGPAPFGDVIYVGGEAIAFVGDTLYYFGDKIVSGIDSLIKNAKAAKNGAEAGGKGGQANNSGKNKPDPTKHSKQRGTGGRPTGRVVNDIQNARTKDVLIQDNGNILVRGNNGRVHVLSPEGTRHITTLTRTNANVRSLIEQGRYTYATKEQAQAIIEMYK